VEVPSPEKVPSPVEAIVERLVNVIGLLRQAVDHHQHPFRLLAVHDENIGGTFE
jgi:hypothetical protein